MENKVFITQRRHDKDVTPAMAYGELVFMLNSSFDVLRDFTEISQHYNKALSQMTDGDYLLLIGSPILISLAAIISSRVLAQQGVSDLRLLQWDRRSELYLPFNISINK